MDKTCTVQELIRGLPVQILHGSPETQVSDIVEDSRLVTNGCLFIARKGIRDDGKQYIKDAIAAGAVAVLTVDLPQIQSDVAILQTKDVATVAAQIAERFHGSPSRSLKLIGVTGTNGKTTISHLVHQLLNRSNKKCGLLSTVQIDDGQTVVPATLTTPPAIEISRQLRAMVDHGCKCCVMEASSHALQQSRTAGLQFDIGVFTNLSGDHLDYHQNMEEYLNAKAKLFEALPRDGYAILNIDDAAAAKLSDRTQAQIIKCSLENSQADCYAQVIEQSITSIDAQFRGPWGEFRCQLPLIGKHNVANALQSLVVCHLLGIDRDSLSNGLASCHAPPGRLEAVTNADHDFAVLVDYAHTDDALKNVLSALRPVVPHDGRLLVVFGCGGDRDQTKRPRMARVACQYADEIIITSDNPRTENPESIIEEIQTGISSDRAGDVSCIVDREQAINTAIERARPGDVVLIAGKGHEDYQIVGTTKRPFDDRKVARHALMKIESRVTVP